MSINTGGPAFSAMDDTNFYSGLRDYFAAKAMQGLLAYSGDEAEAKNHLGTPSKEFIAHNAYLYADAMLRAREE